VVAAMPLLGDVHLDGTGPLRQLWRTRASVAVEDVDVAGSGAAVVCFRGRRRESSDAWRVRAILRSASGAWSRPVLVAAPDRWVEHVDC
jgi:hypothetical protein